ncbi:speckle-type POZ protein-like [Microplitis mediator]|uniref:speckle-type POZ protein-like n=1 Tax=Microplitis mediator TaxID=375433 RepID=UPI0025532E2C|nr:speckle-type POZ protein-like [Microplitis mediator]XP_057326785.1 speckle-type POZ protein-like [Microplitis mediator]
MTSCGPLMPSPRMVRVYPEVLKAEYKWSLPARQYPDWTESEYFTFPNYDKLYFAVCLRDVFTSTGSSSAEIRIRKKGIYDPSRVDIKISAAFIPNNNNTITMKGWVDQYSNKLTFPSRSTLPREIFCEISMNKSDIISNIDGFRLKIAKKSKSMSNYFFSPELSDVTLKVQDEEIPAHKLILAFHSPVFKTMFNTDMRETTENRICLEGFDVDTIKEVLRFMYSGNIAVENDIELLLKILSCTNMYQITSLRILCEYQLIQNFTVDNIIKILVETDRFEVPILHEKAMLYLNCNRERISYSEAIKELNNSKVLQKFFMERVGMKISDE